MLPSFVSSGWATLFEPVHTGYLITLPKLISAVSATISFSHYPAVSTALAFAATAAIAVAVAVAPTALKGRALCALAMFAIPSDPEVFGLPLYTFWWAALLLFLLALWERSADLRWRLPILAIGGLSSPIILLVLPVLAVRAAVYRIPAERILGYTAVTIAAIQCSFIWLSDRAGVPNPYSVLVHVVPKFFGSYIVGNMTDQPWHLWAAGGFLIVFIVWHALVQPRFAPLVLLYLLAGSIAMSAVVIDPLLIHQATAGPRYFFYPFILISWLLVQAALRRKWPGMLALAFLVISILNAIPVWARGHDDLDWQAHVRSCALFPAYTFPTHYDGRESAIWTPRESGKRWVFRLAGAQCARLLNNDPLNRKNGKTFPYTVSGWRTKTNHAVYGNASWRLRKGDSLLYKGEGATLAVRGHEREYVAKLPKSADWLELEFSNATLPEHFSVTIHAHEKDGSAAGR